MSSTSNNGDQSEIADHSMIAETQTESNVLLPGDRVQLERTIEDVIPADSNEEQSIQQVSGSFSGKWPGEPKELHGRAWWKFVLDVVLIGCAIFFLGFAFVVKPLNGELVDSSYVGQRVLNATGYVCSSLEFAQKTAARHYLSNHFHCHCW